MVFLQSPPLITLGQNEGRANIRSRLQDADTTELINGLRYSRRSCGRFRRLQDVYSDFSLSSPRLDVDIDRNARWRWCVTPDAIANTLYDAYGNRRVTTITAAS